MEQQTLQSELHNLTSSVTFASEMLLNRTFTPTASVWLMNTATNIRLATAGFAVFGLIGNTLAIFVLCHGRMWCSTAYLLVILALYDDALLLIHIYRVFDKSPLTVRLKVFQTIAFGPVNWTATSGTIYMTLMVTVERFLAVTSPLRSRIMFSLRAARWVSLVVLLGAVLYNLPHWFAFNYAPQQVNGSMLTTFGLSAAYTIVYKRHLQLSLMYVLPWATMVVLNILLLRAVQGNRAFREASGRKVIRDVGARLTLPVIAVTFVFFFCYPFPAIEDYLCNELNCEKKVIIILRLVSEMTKVFNSTANFLFYCCFGRRFRRTFFHMIFAWRSLLSRSKSGYQHPNESLLYQLENRTSILNNHSFLGSDA